MAACLDSRSEIGGAALHLQLIAATRWLTGSTQGLQNSEKMDEDGAIRG
jgi:hypothetical protein